MDKKINEYRHLVENELKKIVERLKTNYNPEKIILFGSLADESIKSGSDIDIIVIKKTKDDPWTRTKKADQFIEHNVPVDVLVYTPKEIEDRLNINDFFVKEIIEKGTILYER